MSKQINNSRRRFVGSSAVTLAAGHGLLAAACARTASAAQTGAPGAHTSFASLKQIKAGVLDVGYAEDGPPNGPVAILLHGWPYDIHTYVDVAPLLAAKGYRVIVPHLRGYGSTRTATVVPRTPTMAEGVSRRIESGASLAIRPET